MKKLIIWFQSLVWYIFTFTMGKLSFKENPNPTGKEKLVVSKGNLNGNFNMLSGISGEYWVSLIPSLNTSGYGLTEDESIKDLHTNIDIFLEYLFGLPDAMIQVELRKMGWTKSQYFKRRYSKSFVDEKGVLQNFDDPTSVKTSSLQTA